MQKWLKQESPCFSCGECQSVDATRENMLLKLHKYVEADNIMTFGSVEGKCDVLIENADKDSLVKELKKRFEPVEFSFLH